MPRRWDTIFYLKEVTQENSLNLVKYSEDKTKLTDLNDLNLDKSESDEYLWGDPLNILK